MPVAGLQASSATLKAAGMLAVNPTLRFGLMAFVHRCCAVPANCRAAAKQPAQPRIDLMSGDHASSSVLDGPPSLGLLKSTDE